MAFTRQVEFLLVWWLWWDVADDHRSTSRHNSQFYLTKSLLSFDT